MTDHGYPFDARRAEEFLARSASQVDVGAEVVLDADCSASTGPASAAVAASASTKKAGPGRGET